MRPLRGRLGSDLFIRFALPGEDGGVLFPRGKSTKRSLKELRSLRILLITGEIISPPTYRGWFYPQFFVGAPDCCVYPRVLTVDIAAAPLLKLAFNHRHILW